ncbi:MAG: hypothetical protein AMJ91_05060 [candidate division Zixibacteria bacterium SM23_73_3]|nr:MAG: hypothetical protein AMJ91_05060 [candidate division Zixibacteria bacterium SM23_73_3]
MEFPKIKAVPIPFTLYDFFGYLLPGITFGALIIFSFDIREAVHLVTNKILGEADISHYPFLFKDFILLLHESPWFISLFGLLVAYLLGHVLAALSSYFVERLLVQSWLKYPTENMFGLSGKKKVFFFRNFRRSHSPNFIAQFKSQFETHFKIPLSSPNDIFWITWSFVAHNCPIAFARSSHFLNLYAFSRNLSMTFLMAALLLFVFELFSCLTVHWLLILLYCLIAVILYWNYLKLLRRLNDEVYRSFYAFVTGSD